MSKVTLATVKAFMRRNESKLLIRVKGEFDGMTDCVESCDTGFQPISDSIHPCKENLGYNGVWIVGGSRNWIERWEDDSFVGFKVGNCCGRFIVAIAKTVPARVGDYPAIMANETGISYERCLVMCNMD